MSLAQLRVQRRLLSKEVRGLRYQRRIAQAQADLAVAALVYQYDDAVGLHRDGDLTDSGADDAGGTGTASGRLLRLRERLLSLSIHEARLQEDLDAVTDELAARLLADSPPVALGMERWG